MQRSVDRPLSTLVLLAILVCLGINPAEANGKSLFQRALSSARRILQIGVTDGSKLLPPVFVQWSDPGTQPSLAELKEFDCQDRADWTYTWPAFNPVVDGGVFCDDFAPGGVGHGFCGEDVGFAIWKQAWMTASEACPRSCGTCCQRICTLPNAAPDCKAKCENGTDSYLSYLRYAEENTERGTEVKPYNTFLNLTRNGSDVRFMRVDNRSVSVRFCLLVCMRCGLVFVCVCVCVCVLSDHMSYERAWIIALFRYVARACVRACVREYVCLCVCVCVSRARAHICMYVCMYCYVHTLTNTHTQ
jgi:hypothetical protein